jgi:hypothetical protein
MSRSGFRKPFRLTTDVLTLLLLVYSLGKAVWPRGLGLLLYIADPCHLTPMCDGAIVLVSVGQGLVYRQIGCPTLSVCTLAKLYSMVPSLSDVHGTKIRRRIVNNLLLLTLAKCIRISSLRRTQGDSGPTFDDSIVQVGKTCSQGWKLKVLIPYNISS